MRPAAPLAMTGLLALAAAALAFQAMPQVPLASSPPLLPPVVVHPVEETRAERLEREMASWTRPEGPVRIALQAGHWRAAEAPDEQAGLRGNGTRGGGHQEWEVNLEIARRAARMLEDSGYVVEVLPTRVPPGYWADLFLSIHADGHANSRASGYRAAAPRRDMTGRSTAFAALLDRVYGEETGLPYYGSVTRRMRGYYAFNYRRYEHALHPMTVGAIIETGFLTSPRDRSVIVADPERAARGITRAVIEFISPVPPPRSTSVTRPLTLSSGTGPVATRAHPAR